MCISFIMTAEKLIMVCKTGKSNPYNYLARQFIVSIIQLIHICLLLCVDAYHLCISNQN
jgi:hypothetical protein